MGRRLLENPGGYGENRAEMFKDLSNRMWTPGGIERPMPARDRKWETKTGRANFLVPATPRQNARAMPKEGGRRLGSHNFAQQRSV